jgi:hypothetical protein
MRLDFCSKFDGALQPADRPPIDVSFVLDISGRQLPLPPLPYLSSLPPPPSSLLLLPPPPVALYLPPSFTLPLLLHFVSLKHITSFQLTYFPRSMSSGFPDDPDRRSKLDVAKDCLLHVSKQLGPRDRMSVITFDTNTETVLPSGYCSPRHLSKQVPLSPPFERRFLLRFPDNFSIQAFQSSSRCALWWRYQPQSRLAGGL